MLAVSTAGWVLKCFFAFSRPTRNRDSQSQRFKPNRSNSRCWELSNCTVELSDFPTLVLGQRQGYSAMESALQRTINSLAPPAFAFAEGKKQDKRIHEQMAKMDDPH